MSARDTIKASSLIVVNNRTPMTPVIFNVKDYRAIIAFKLCKLGIIQISVKNDNAAILISGTSIIDKIALYTVNDSDA
ncbi:MAG: hypothetical protein ACR2QW_13860 [bacterium]